MGFYLLEISNLDCLFICRNHEYSLKTIYLSLVFVKFKAIFVE